MAARRKQDTLEKIGSSVKGAAQAVASTADEYVVQPVGKALGLTGKKKPARKAGRKATAGKAGARKAAPTAKRATPKRAAKR